MDGGQASLFAEAPPEYPVCKWHSECDVDQILTSLQVRARRNVESEAERTA